MYNKIFTALRLDTRKVGSGAYIDAYNDEIAYYLPVAKQDARGKPETC